MKKLSVIVFGVIAAVISCCGSSYAVNDLLVPKSEDGSKQWTHFFTPSFRTRLQFDDNCTSSNRRQASWEGLMAPKVAFKLPYEKSFVGASWEYTLIGYGNRPADRADNNQDVNFTWRQDITDRITLGVKQFFQYRQQPFVPWTFDDAYMGYGTQPYAWMFTTPNLSENADYGYYVGTFGVDYRMNKKISFDFTYNVEYLDFMQNSGIVRPSMNQLNHTLVTVLNYRLLPTTLFLVDFRYIKGDYKIIEKDYDEFVIASGIKNRIGTSVIINGRAGFEYRVPKMRNSRELTPSQIGISPMPSGDTEIGKNRSNEPFVEADMTYLFSKATQVKFGYKLKVIDTEQPTYTDKKAQGVYGAITHKLTAKTYLLFFCSQETDYYINYREMEGNVNTGAGGYEPQESMTKVGFLLTQQLKPWMFLELGYRFVNQHSDFSPFGWSDNFTYTDMKGTAPNASYTRNRIFSGINIVF